MLRSSLILLFGTFILSSILTPAIYSTFITIWPDFPWPFARVYDRVAMVCVMIFVYIERKNFKLGMVKEYYRFREPSLDLCLFTLGMVLCFSSSMFVLPVIVERGFLAWDPVALQGAYWRLLREFPAALLIGLLEETFFRVLLFQTLTKRWSPAVAAVFTSAIYALVHFITPVKDWVYPGYSPLVGFYYIEAVLQRTLVPSVYLAFIGLFLVGMVLCYVIHTTKRFYLCAGMHAGWILSLKFSFFATDIQPGYSFDLGAGRRYFLVAEPTAWLTILGVFGFAFLISRMLERSSPKAA